MWSRNAIDLNYRDPRVVGDAEIENWGDTLTLTYDVSDAVQIKSITGYSRLTQALVGQLGATHVLAPVLNPVDPTNPVEPISAHSSPSNPGKQRQFSQELQLLGNSGDISYVLGAYYWNEKVHEDVTTILGSIFAGSFIRVNRSVVYDQEVESLAGFGQITFRPAALDDRLEITLGGRYTTDKTKLNTRRTQRTFSTTVTTDARSEKWDNFGYSGSISYDIADDVMLYGRIASSFRAGGFNALSPGDPGYDPEEAVSYEAGIKADVADRRMRLNLNLFQLDYDNLQVNQYNSTTLTNFVVNAGKARYRGAEFEGVALIGPHLQVDGNVGYVDGEYQEYFLIQNGQPVNVASTAHFAQLSNWTTHVGAQFKSDMTPLGYVTLRGDYDWKSSARLTTLDFLAPTLQSYRSGAQKNLSARLILSDIPVGNSLRLTAQVYGNNLTNNRYYSYVVDFASLASATFNRPRNYGVKLSAEF